MKQSHFKKLEKITKALEIINDEFQRLLQESNRLDHTSNGNFAESRLEAANSVIQNIYDEFKYSLKK